MLDLFEKKCACCGKIFFPTYNHVFVIKTRQGQVRAWFCKYTCMNKYREEQRAKRQYRKRGEVDDIQA